jgi:hypothetical protein
MKRIVYGAAICASFAVACSTDEPTEGAGTQAEKLTYISPGPFSAGPLVKKSFAEPNEANRQTNTHQYYDSIQVSANGTTNLGTITNKIPTLGDFKSVYGFASADVAADYYNRGDLGIGREMHCADRFAVTGQIACYVRNFAAGDEQTEFRFGMSADVAFGNRDANHPFATVAMVFRKNAASNKVLFVVYDASEHLTFAAPLDRHGLNFALGRTDNQGATGTPGVNFNNHIPSNCANCHGGTYDPASKVLTGGLFLPFDLDQFEYQNANSSRTRAAQAAAFKTLNSTVRTVATQVGGAGTEVATQIDGWYASGSFDSNYIPTGWQGNVAQKAVYTSVIRPSCRGCHMTSAIFPFASAAAFPTGAAAADLCGLAMPHALQNLREFWQSPKPAALAAYFNSTAPNGTVVDAASATKLQGCAPGQVVTLDPPQLAAATSGVF